MREAKYPKSNHMDEEKKFLHAISSPITSLHLNLENAIGLLEDAGGGERVVTCLALLRKSLEQVKKSTTLIRERREICLKTEERSDK